MKAVVLAAGEGARLQPITSNRPKHMIELAGKPILEYCLDALKLSGITEVAIVTHYMGDTIRQFLGDGTKMGLKISYVQQDEVLGTANAVGVAESYVGEDFVLVYGDLLFTHEAVVDAITLYREKKPAAVMAVVPVEKQENYGVAELENDGKIKLIVEKPAPEESSSDLANAGIYVLSKEVFDKIKEAKASIRGELEFTEALSFLIGEGKTVLASKISKADWIDIGRPWDLLEANSWALKRRAHKVCGTVEAGAHLLGPVTVQETARIRSGAYIEGPSFIGEGSDIGPNCYIRPCTSIGKNVRIGNACEVKNSLIMDGTHIGHLSYVGDSILCEHCNMAAGTIMANLRLDGKSVKMLVKGEVVDSGRRKLGAVLGDNVKTGINALLMPGVKIGPRSWIGANFTVHRDVSRDSIVMLKQNEDRREKSV
ncbi:MAG: sugar phosphate nucleotidyltransferase [Candidatus Bathyarchaeota archaeon]|nr:sugar phosphate nucleotidyltransferase [Candidatus Bathyarchaeota archaeon]